MFENKLYSLELDYTQAGIIYKFLTVNSYDRLYDEYRAYNEEIKSKDIAMQGSGKKLHFIETVHRLKDEDKITDIIIMNQLSLGVLLELYVKNIAGIKEGDIKILHLNSILIYELYVTVCEKIISKEIEYISYNNATSDYKLKTNCAFIINILKNICEQIEALVGLKELSIIEIEYKNITIKSHLELCLQEL